MNPRGHRFAHCRARGEQARDSIRSGGKLPQQGSRSQRFCRWTEEDGHFGDVTRAKILAFMVPPSAPANAPINAGMT